MSSTYEDNIYKLPPQMRPLFIAMSQSPVTCAEQIRSHLFPEYVGTDGVLKEFTGFFRLLGESAREVCSDLALDLVDSGILTTLMSFILTPNCWKDYEQGRMPLTIIMDLMYCSSLFMLLVSPTTGPSMVTPLVDYVVREKNEELVNLFQILWRHRHDFLQDPDHDPLHLFRRPQNDYVGKIVFDFVTTLETFRRAGRSIFDMSPDIEPLMFYSWSQASYSPVQQAAALHVLLRYISRRTGSHADLRMDLTELRDAKDMMKVCIWSLRKDATFEDSLTDLFRTMACMIERLPRDFYQDLQDLWIQLLANVARIGKRQLCKDVDELPGRIILVFNMIARILPRMFPLEAVTARDAGILAGMDLIPLAARCGPIVLAHAEYGECRLWHVPMIHKLAAMKCTSSRHKEVSSRLRQTLKTYGPDTIAALSAIVSNNPAVKKKQTELITHWRTYARVLGISDLASVHLTKEPSFPCPWETCNWKACLCHEKAASHKLYVCKGCWQAYYCSKKCQAGDWQDGHATICRQKTAARVNP